MMENKGMSNSELQQHHYKAVRENADYRHEGMMNVLYEEMMMNMPVFSQAPLEEIPPVIYTTHIHSHRNKELEDRVKGVEKATANILSEIHNPINKDTINIERGIILEDEKTESEANGNES